MAKIPTLISGVCMFVGMPMCEGRRKNSECCSSNLASCPPLPPATRVSCVYLCIQRPREDARCPVLSLSALFPSDNSLRVWSVASSLAIPLSSYLHSCGLTGMCMQTGSAFSMDSGDLSAGPHTVLQVLFTHRVTSSRIVLFTSKGFSSV